jgi:hypothetical protein
MMICWRLLLLLLNAIEKYPVFFDVFVIVNNSTIKVMSKMKDIVMLRTCGIASVGMSRHGMNAA